jgi:Protein of unknown function (DUF1579)
MKSVLFITILFLTQSIFTQALSQNKSNCDCTECHQLDFWIGNWKAVWQDSSGNVFEGTNHIEKILGDCVIMENFDGNPGIEYTGKSFSVFNQKTKTWQQTWVDSQGSYMLFTGGKQDDKMILSREVETKKGKVMQRMVFYNITDDSFDWNWEASIDDDLSWRLNWQIHYTRE